MSETMVGNEDMCSGERSDVEPLLVGAFMGIVAGMMAVFDESGSIPPTGPLS